LGFKKLALPNVVLMAGTTQTQDLSLPLGAVEETVTVTGQAPQVDVTSVQVGTTVALQEVRGLPALATNVVAYLQTVRGVSYQQGQTLSAEGFTVNGQTNGNQFYTDGGSNLVGTFACCGNRIVVPTDVVQEISVITSQIPAEYGGRTGAVVNAVTKQGTNAFHGSAHVLFANQAIIGSHYFVHRDGLAKPDQGNCKVAWRSAVRSSEARCSSLRTWRATQRIEI
jgi:hypothetical protein